MSAKKSNPEGMFKFKGLSQIAEAGQFVFTAGQVALDEKGNLVGGQDVEAQLRKVWDNVEFACRKAGGSLDSLVKTTTYIVSPEAFGAVAKVRTEKFGDGGPANATLIVAGLARPEWLVEIEAIAYVGR